MYCRICGNKVNDKADIFVKILLHMPIIFNIVLNSYYEHRTVEIFCL